MEDSYEAYKRSISLISSANKDTLNTLSSLNKQTLNFFSDERIQNVVRQLNTISIPQISLNTWFSDGTLKTINTITNSYQKVFDSLEIGKSLLPSIANAQVSTLLQLSQSVQTEMIVNISKCFVNARYDLLANTINESIRNFVIPASDIGFIRTSDFVNSIKAELDYPRGLISTIQTINILTAKELSCESRIDYNTKRNRFETENEAGETDARGLNVICSCKCILNQSPNDEAFSNSELINFVSFISSTPMMALKNETGRRINGLIEDLFSNGKRTIGFDRKVYYHCRSHKATEMDYTFDEMLRAPHGLPWAGRFNHVGISHYYFSDTKDGAEKEVRKHLSLNDVLQTIKIIPNRNNLFLDLSGTWQKHSIFLHNMRFSLHDNNTEKMPREYLLSCFVSDCCKNAGFDGIKYYGSKDYNNYVTWGSDCFRYGGLCS